MQIITMDLDYYSNNYINNQMIVTGKHTAHPDLCKKKKKKKKKIVLHTTQ